MDIRVAEYSDYESIAKLHAQSWRMNYQGVMDAVYLRDEVDEERSLIWQTRLINPPINQHVVLAEEGNQLCGFICAFGNHDFDKGSIIESLHVAPEYQGKGLAKLLIREATEWIQHYFPDTGVYLEVTEENIKAIQFYDHLGGLHEMDRIWHTPCGCDISEWIYTWETPQAILSAVE
ncbi:GNAT family N-acetyltransferase [Vibrio quintilis]|uniref:Putative acetyltransferase n=1 Tax=Vibrio quintilis TaxID=1117707 RepID=A0A1M7YXE5_9VIBR|nr:GNAT family N-acetyltransferase [Vibrio quintilis]SHO57347.1 putative acetyltransferase [Vibrio quintilis]